MKVEVTPSVGNHAIKRYAQRVDRALCPVADRWQIMHRIVDAVVGRDLVWGVPSWKDVADAKAKWFVERDEVAYVLRTAGSGWLVATVLTPLVVGER